MYKSISTGMLQRLSLCLKGFSVAFQDIFILLLLGVGQHLNYSES